MSKGPASAGRALFVRGAVARWITGPRVLLAGGALYVGDSFLPWNRACRVECLSFTLWHGIGVAASVTASVLALWEFGLAAGVRPRIALGRHRVSAGLGLLVSFFTVLKVAVDFAYLWLGAWLGLALAAAIAYGAFLRARDPS